MLRFTRGKVLAIIAACLLGVIFAIPNFIPEADREAFQRSLPSWIPSWIVPTKAITLGLDLQGGSHVLMEVDVADLTRTQVTTLRDDVRRLLRETRVSPQGGIGAIQRGVQVRVPDAADRERLLPRLRELAQPVGNQTFGPTGQTSLAITEGEGGTIQIAYTELGITDRIRRAVDQAIEVIRRRIDETGVREPSIQRQGSDRILVQLPGVGDPQQIKELLGRTAKLEFRMLAEPGLTSGETDQLPSRDSGGQNVAVERQVIVDGADLVDAQPAFDQRTNEPIVNFRFNLRGAQRFGQATSANVGRPLAIVLDNEVISAPRILSPITGGQGQISGNFTVEAANNLAILLRAGALPAKLTVVEERSVGPGLGADSIRAGVTASIIGTILVALYMIASYGIFGVIANIAVVVNIIFVVALLALVGATLTLPGIAGIVLTVGMAVDSNVLIYERIREEQRLGRSVISSLDAGFSRALATIVDSNITTLVAAVVLFLLGSGPVRGFAVTLALGIAASMFTAFTLTRLLVAYWYRWKRPVRIPL